MDFHFSKILWKEISHLFRKKKTFSTIKSNDFFFTFQWDYIIQWIALSLFRFNLESLEGKF